MDRLPTELHFEIFRKIYHYKQTYRIDRVTLARCCLVCRRWRNLAQPLLFHHVLARELIHANSLLKVVAEKSNSLREHVRILEVELKDGEIGLIVMFILTTVFPSLYELRLDLQLSLTAFIVHSEISETWWTAYTYDGLSPDFARSSKISSLRINGNSTSANVIARFILLVPWPIQYLSLSVSLSGICPKTSPSYQLKELRANRLSLTALVWLLRRSTKTNSLKALHMPCHLFLTPWDTPPLVQTGPNQSIVPNVPIPVMNAVENMRKNVTKWYIPGGGPPRATEEEIVKIPTNVKEIGFTMLDSKNAIRDALATMPRQIRKVSIALVSEMDRFRTEVMDPDSSSCFYFRFFSRSQGEVWREEENETALSWSWPVNYSCMIQNYPFEELPMVANPHWPYSYWCDMNGI